MLIFSVNELRPWFPAMPESDNSIILYIVNEIFFHKILVCIHGIDTNLPTRAARLGSNSKRYLFR